MSESPQEYLARINRQRRRRRQQPAPVNWVTATGGTGFPTLNKLDAFIERIHQQQQQQYQRALGDDVHYVVDDT